MISLKFNELIQNINPATQLLRRFFHPTMKKMVSSTHAFRRKQHNVSRKTPMSWPLGIFPHGTGTVFFGQQFVFICVFSIYKNHQKSKVRWKGK